MDGLSRSWPWHCLSHFWGTHLLNLAFFFSLQCSSSDFRFNFRMAGQSVNRLTRIKVEKAEKLKLKKNILVCLRTRCKLHRWRWRWLPPDPARRAGSFVGKRPLEHRLGRSVGRAPAFNHKITLLAQPWHLTSDFEDLLGNLRAWFLWKSFGFCEVVAFWKQHFSAI